MNKSNFNNTSLSSRIHIILNPEPSDDNHVTTKANVESLSENDRKKRDLSSLYNDQDKDSDNNKLTTFDSLTVSRNPTIDKELSKKNFVDDSIGEASILKFNQTLQTYLRLSADDIVYIVKN